MGLTDMILFMEEAFEMYESYESWAVLDQLASITSTSKYPQRG